MNSDQMYDILQAIGTEGSRKGKMNWMEDGMKPMFFLALNPFFNYQVRTLPRSWGGNIKGRTMTEADWALLLKLNKRAVTGKKARQEIRQTLKALTPKSAHLLRRVLLKKLRCGVGIKLVNEKWPNLIPEFHVMKANKIEDVSPVKLNWPYYVSPKFDGIRAIYKNGVFFFRSGRIIKGLPHLQKDLAGVNVSLDGELMIPGMDNYTASGRLRSGNLTLDARYFVFDCPSVEGTLDVRMEQAQIACFGKQFCETVAHVIVNDNTELTTWYLSSLKLGYEGVMLKDTTHHYLDGRSNAWLKKKKSDLFDVVVVDFYEGEGKYRGMLGGFVVQLGSVKFNCGGGYSDLQRKQFWEDRHDCIDRVMSVRAQEVTPDGALREPRFKGFRHDL